MGRELWFFLFIVITASYGLFAPAALAATDDGSGPVPQSTEEAYGGQPRYLVTFMKSRTTDPIRTATVVSVTNQASGTCQISVDWFRGFETSPACTTTFVLGAGFQTDFCSRTIPDALTTCNTTCTPELTFHEGKAVVSSSTRDDCRSIGVSARVYYTSGSADDEVTAISDSKIMRFGQGNRGD